jgi:hypothetical protein
MSHSERSLAARLRGALLALGGALPLAGLAQNYDAMIQQQMNAMNANIARGQQVVNGIVQQRMADPQVQAGYRQHLARMRAAGRPPMDYPTYTYHWVYTNGFSAQGIAHARANEAGVAAAERAAVQRLRNAEQQRGAAQQAQRDGYFANQQEAGRQLLGQSTWIAPNGAALALPHTWQRNTTHVHQGQTYRVDASGQYHVLGANGWWYPLQPR